MVIAIGAVVFQSAPPPLGGGDSHLSSLATHSLWFQSAPPPLGGGDECCSGVLQENGEFQSAPPPLGGGDYRVLFFTPGWLCFNPRPPRLEGATR